MSEATMKAISICLVNEVKNSPGDSSGNVQR
jgi:hypothetical protein